MPKSLPIAGGRKFGCTMCGNCCSLPGYVFMTWRELAAIADRLGLTPEEFRGQYGVVWMSDFRSWAIDATDGEGCPLLDERRLCSVNDVKPAQCKAFPFWPELLDDKNVWEETKRYCPGLDAEGGRLYSEEEIVSIRSLMEKDED